MSRSSSGWFVPALSVLLPARLGVSRAGLHSAPTRLLRQPSGKVFHLPRSFAPHGARAPRGAPAAVHRDRGPDRKCPGRDDLCESARAHPDRPPGVPARVLDERPPAVRTGRRPGRCRVRDPFPTGRRHDHRGGRRAGPGPVGGPRTRPTAITPGCAANCATSVWATPRIFAFPALCVHASYHWNLCAACSRRPGLLVDQDSATTGSR